MTDRRRKFYLYLAAAFPIFFLLHWNGLFSHTYYWALEATDSTQRPGPQAAAALLSAAVIFAVLASVFEGITRRSRPHG